MSARARPRRDSPGVRYAEPGARGAGVGAAAPPDPAPPNPSAPPGTPPGTAGARQAGLSVSRRRAGAERPRASRPVLSEPTMLCLPRETKPPTCPSSLCPASSQPCARSQERDFWMGLKPRGAVFHSQYLGHRAGPNSWIFGFSYIYVFLRAGSKSAWPAARSAPPAFPQSPIGLFPVVTDGRGTRRCVETGAVPARFQGVAHAAGFACTPASPCPQSSLSPTPILERSSLAINRLNKSFCQWGTLWKLKTN